MLVHFRVDVTSTCKIVWKWAHVYEPPKDGEGAGGVGIILRHGLNQEQVIGPGPCKTRLSLGS